MKAEVKLITWHDKQPVLSVDFQPGSSRIATAGADNNVRIWTLVSNGNNDKTSSMTSSNNIEYLATLARHTMAVNVVRFDLNGVYLASAGDDGAVILWKLSGKEPQRSNLLGNEDEDSKEVWVAAHILRDKSDDIYDLCWSPDSLQLAVGSVDNIVRIWDTQKGVCIKKLTEHSHYVQGVAWDPLNKFLASQSSDRTCRIYQRNPKQIFSLVGKVEKYALPAAAQKDKEKDKEGGSGATSQTVKMFADESLPTFFRRLTFTPDGSLLIAPAGCIPKQGGDHQPAATSEDSEEQHLNNTVFLFGRRNLLEPVIHLPGQTKPAVVVRCCPLFFELRGGAGQPNPPSLIDLPYRMVFAVATLDSVLFYDTQQRDPIAMLSKFHYSAITDVAWSNDGHSVMVSSRDGFCSLIQFAEGELGKVMAPPASLTEQQQQQQQQPLLPVTSTSTTTSTSTPSTDPSQPENDKAEKTPALPSTSSTRPTPPEDPTPAAASFAIPSEPSPNKRPLPTATNDDSPSSSSSDSSSSRQPDPKKRRITPQLISSNQS